MALKLWRATHNPKSYKGRFLGPTQGDPVSLSDSVSLVFPTQEGEYLKGVSGVANSDGPPHSLCETSPLPVRAQMGSRILQPFSGSQISLIFTVS